jgi:hypothetical protein
LYQNYPNPFNPFTKIRFDIPEASAVTLVIYDITGKTVEIAADNIYLPPGKYEAAINGSEYSSGIYFYTISTGKFRNSRKMILLK